MLIVNRNIADQLQLENIIECDLKNAIKCEALFLYAPKLGSVEIFRMLGRVILILSRITHTQYGDKH